jgi:hypothetical protein
MSTKREHDGKPVSELKRGRSSFFSHIESTRAKMELYSATKASKHVTDNDVELAKKKMPIALSAVDAWCAKTPPVEKSVAEYIHSTNGVVKFDFYHIAQEIVNDSIKSSFGNWLGETFAPLTWDLHLDAVWNRLESFVEIVLARFAATDAIKAIVDQLRADYLKRVHDDDKVLELAKELAKQKNVWLADMPTLVDNNDNEKSLPPTQTTEENEKPETEKEEKKEVEAKIVDEPKKIAKKQKKPKAKKESTKAKSKPTKKSEKKVQVEEDEDSSSSSSSSSSSESSSVSEEKKRAKKKPKKGKSKEKTPANEEKPAEVVSAQPVAAVEEVKVVEKQIAPDDAMKEDKKEAEPAKIEESIRAQPLVVAEGTGDDDGGATESADDDSGKVEKKKKKKKSKKSK